MKIHFVYRENKENPQFIFVIKVGMDEVEYIISLDDEWNQGKISIKSWINSALGKVIRSVSVKADNKQSSNDLCEPSRTLNEYNK